MLRHNDVYYCVSILEIAATGHCIPNEFLIMFGVLIE